MKSDDDNYNNDDNYFQWIEGLEDMKELVSLRPHVSTLLILQIIHSLSLKYFDNLEINNHNNNFSYSNKIEMSPFINRFHGVLLFLDISGFTVLSQRMTVESLQKHINNYFSKMINIIHTYEGEVIKFAGDALYVVWKTSIVDPFTFFDKSIDEGENSDIKININKAVHCALHINKECNNFEITVGSAMLTSSDGQQQQQRGLMNLDEEKSARFSLRRQSLLSEEDEFKHDSELNFEEKFYLSGIFIILYDNNNNNDN